MKVLKCEICGSTELVKQDEFFVCQYCGAKYSPEEAKKMMIEGTVDVSGSTVKVDDSAELENLYKIARRAKDDNNSENAAKYYDMILIKDPNSWEASFYVVYYKAISCKLAEMTYAINSLSNCLGTVLNLIDDNVNDEFGKALAIKEVSDCCFDSLVIFISGITEITNNYSNSGVVGGPLLDETLQKNCATYLALANMMYTLGDNIENIFGEKEYKIVPDAYKLGIKFNMRAIDKLKQREQKETSKYIIAKYANKIQKYDSSYQAPTVDSSYQAPTVNTTVAKNGCYVATCVYGSYDCPQVWTLRRYRDEILSETWYGRAFIHTYYTVSPTLVKCFGHTKWFKHMWKGKLDHIVSDLNSKGFQDTPYIDKNW